MIKLTITAKGQIRLNRELRKHLGVSPGAMIEVDKLPDARILMRAVAQDGNIDDFIGCLSHGVRPKLKIEEMNEVATRGWAK